MWPSPWLQEQVPEEAGGSITVQEAESGLQRLFIELLLRSVPSFAFSAHFLLDTRSDAKADLSQEFAH